MRRVLQLSALGRLLAAAVAGCGTEGVPAARHSLPAPAASAPEKYAISFALEPRQGDRYRERVSHRVQRRVVTQPPGEAPVQRTIERQTNFQAKLLVVDSNAARVVHRYQIERLDSSDERRPPIELPPGAVALVTSDAQGIRFTIDGGQPSPELAVVGESVFRIGARPTGRDPEDAFMGTTEPRAPGESWAPNATAFQEALGTPLAESEGLVTFVGPKPCPVGKCIALRVRLARQRDPRLVAEAGESARVEYARLERTEDHLRSQRGSERLYFRVQTRTSEAHALVSPGGKRLEATSLRTSDYERTPDG